MKRITSEGKTYFFSLEEAQIIAAGMNERVDHIHVREVLACRYIPIRIIN